MRRYLRLMAALVFLAIPLRIEAGDHADRAEPDFARQPVGNSYQQDVPVGQKIRMVRDVSRATVGDLVHQPIRSARVETHRLGERLGVRLRESLPTPLARSFQPEWRESGGPLTPARLSFLFDSEPAYRGLMEAIADATTRIDFMLFGWDNDEVGRSVASALIARARNGVLVRVMIDRGGFVLGPGNDRKTLASHNFVDALRAEPNIRVIETPDGFFRFDHRKVAIFDDRLVWAGGMILTEDSHRRWHNFGYLAEGEIVPQFSSLFDARWEELGGCRIAHVPCVSPQIGPNTSVRMVRTDLDERSLKQAIYGGIDSAKQRIMLENPYFSDENLVQKLCEARRRGVDVRVILTMRGNIKIFNEYSRLTANRLLKGGVRVFLYPRMTHVKAMSVDGEWAYIGSGNFDELSLRNNREVGLTIRGSDVVAALDSGLFGPDIAVSEELLAILPAPKRKLLLEALSLLY